MKAFFCIMFIGAAFSMSSCENGNRETATKESTAPESVINSPTANVVTDSVTDDQGNVLDMKFDNSAGTATLVLGKDSMFLTQDTTASGIRYSNQHYIFTEHQGNITLTKDGNTIFKRNN